MSKLDEVAAELEGVGISEHDALVIADCIVTRKSCSWVNIDLVNDKILKDLHNLIEKQNYRIKVNVQPVPTRGKFIWEVKVE
ncbi:hypothetical protein KKB44_05425 [Candidatus Micrarchaeota archaeon]|nr:hypothetical protein [Candidatus Micrarchaeota archaeon]